MLQVWEPLQTQAEYGTDYPLPAPTLEVCSPERIPSPHMCCSSGVLWNSRGRTRTPISACWSRLDCREPLASFQHLGAVWPQQPSTQTLLWVYQRHESRVFFLPFNVQKDFPSQIGHFGLLSFRWHCYHFQETSLLASALNRAETGPGLPLPLGQQARAGQEWSWPGLWKYLL